MKGKNFSRGLSKILSVIVSFALIFGTLPMIAQAAPKTGSYYERVTSVTSGQNYVIVANTSNYALTAPTSATSVTVSGNYITSTVSSSMEWTLTSVGSAYYITNGTTYLIRGSGSTLTTGSQSQADSSHGQWSYSSSNNRISITSYGSTYYLYRNGSSFGLSNTSNTVYLYQKKTLAITGIAVNQAPDKTVYNEGETFEPAGMVIRATYNDGSYEDISTVGSPDGYTFTPTGALSASDHSVSVSYGGRSTTQAITVNARTVTSIEISSPPTKTTYDEGETFDPAGMVVTAHYSDDTNAPVTGYTVDPSGSLTPSDHSVTITYNGRTATQAITVNALVLDHIAITAPPTKTAYIEGQLFDPAGMVVRAYFTNGSNAAITTYTWSPNDELATGATQVTVSYNGMHVIQPITVAAKALDHIGITTPPTKTTYVAGQSFSSAGMAVKAYYNNDTNEAVTGYTIDPSGPLTMGVTKVTVSYTYSSVTRTADQNITVIAKAVDHIAITTPPTKTAYVEGQTFDPSGMVVTAYYNDDTNAPATGYTYSPTRTLVTTDTNVTVSYGGKTANQPITVAVATHAETPTISPDTPVEWMAVDIGATANLSVSASVSKGVLTYQWYSNTTAINSGGTPVAPSSSDPSLLLNTAVAGNTFYYCVVTNTDTTATGNQTATATSRVAQVVVRRDAQTPNIVPTSPANMSVYQNSSSSITVSAYIDAGALTYQWYSNTTGLNSGGTPEGTSSGSPTLTLNTSTAGTKYYYCVVTNTDYGAPGIQTASATSRAARVIVSGFAKGTLLLTFDDGWTDQYTNAYPILNAKGFKATAYVNSDFIIQHESGIMSVTQAQDLYAHGWDIANHTSTHEDEGVGDRTDQAHLAQLKAMYNDCATWLTTNGMPRAAYHVAYPSGLYSQDLIRLLKLNGYKTGRATIFGLQSAIQYQNDYFNLPVYSLGDTNDLAACLAGIDEAANTGTTLIIMIHKVESHSGDLVTLTSWLQDIVNRAKTQVDANKLQVMTMTEWFEAQGVVGAGQTPPAPSVTGNDATNTVSGLSLVMEYKLDSAPGYTIYDPTTFASLNLAGDHILAVRYAASGADPAGPDTTLTFTKLLSSISITTPPTKTAYVEGTVFDPAGMVVTAHYDDGTSAAVTGYTVDPSGELTTANTKVTISYTLAGVTRTADQAITVSAKKLSSIAITTQPTKKIYVEGTLFDPAGMVVTAIYDNGTYEPVTGYTIDPSGELATSDTKVTVSYTYASLTRTAEQAITVNEKALDHIAITTPPNKTVYIEGNTFDPAGMVVTAYYNNGKSEAVTGYVTTPSTELTTADTRVDISYNYRGVLQTTHQPITVNAKSLDHIAITTEPTKKIYIEGNVFNPAGMVVTAYYDNGKHEDVLGYSVTPSGPLATTDTKVTVSYTFSGVTRTVDQMITVHPKSLTRIEITTPPTKTAYVEGNTFSTAGMVVTAFYDNDTSGVVTGYSVDPVGPLTAADVRVTISYTYVGVTRTAEQPITVASASLDHIAITTMPSKTVYIEGQTFDPAGMVVTAYYNNGMSGTITGYSIDPSGELATTDTKVTVSYVGKTAEQLITVNAKKLSSIAVTTEPTKKTYIEGNLFDPAGMVITAYYDNGKHEAVTGYSTAPSGELATTDTKVTISYTYAGLTRTAEQTIMVNAKALDHIAITTPPSKTIYIEGQTFDPAGMTVTAYYNNGKSEAVTGYTIIPAGELATTDTKATISYTYAGLTRTAEQSITVNAKTLSSIAITTEPTKTQYIEGQTFDATGMVVTAYFDNGKHEAVTGYTITPSGELATTDTKVTVSYTFAGVSRTFDQAITVAPKSLNHIGITTPPAKTAYIEGNHFDPAGMVVTAYFDNGTSAAVTGYSITPSGELAITDTKVTVNYGGKTAEQVITVAAKSLDHIAITSAPTKTHYIEGQTFEPAGMVVTAYYDNGTTGQVTGYTWQPGAALATADTKVTVSFTYAGVTKTTDQAITVIAKAITGLAFKTHPTTANYVEGQTFNPAGMVLTATYNDGSSKEVQPDECTFSINRPLQATDTSIDVIYDSMHVTQGITVLTKAALQLTCKDDRGAIFPIGLAIYSDQGLTHRIDSKVANSVTGVILFSGLNAGTCYVTVASVPSPYHLPTPNVAVQYTVAYGQINKQTFVLPKSLVYSYTSAQLKNITATAGTLSPMFDPDIKSYTLLLNERTARTTIKPVLADASSKLYINGRKATSRTVTLATAQKTKVTIKVQPKTGKSMTYTVTVKRAASTNTSLSYIKSSRGSLTKVNATNYTVNLSKTQTSTTFRLKLADKTAKYSMTLDGRRTTSRTVSIKPGATRTLVITVTPQAGSAYAVKYTVKIIRAISHNANLAALKASRGALAPAFDPTQVKYSLALASMYSSTRLTIKLADSTAKYSITAGGRRSGSTISLARGTTKEVIITVTSQAGDKKYYTITITRAS